jgi:hypothetical protein
MVNCITRPAYYQAILLGCSAKIIANQKDPIDSGTARPPWVIAALYVANPMTKVIAFSLRLMLSESQLSANFAPGSAINLKAYQAK